MKTSSNEEYVMVGMGNDALVQCVVPSFVADLVSVVQWEESEGTVYLSDDPLGGNI